MSYQPGEILLEKYRIESLLGQGAFGDVYKVTHLRLIVPRALKILRRDAPGVGSTLYEDGLQCFKLEAQLGARLNSPSANPRLLQVYGGCLPAGCQSVWCLGYVWKCLGVDGFDL